MRTRLPTGGVCCRASLTCRAPTPLLLLLTFIAVQADRNLTPAGPWAPTVRNHWRGGHDLSNPTILPLCSPFSSPFPSRSVFPLFFFPLSKYSYTGSGIAVSAVTVQMTVQVTNSAQFPRTAKLFPVHSEAEAVCFLSLTHRNIFTVQHGCIKWRFALRLNHKPRCKNRLILQLQKTSGIKRM